MLRFPAIFALLLLLPPGTQAADLSAAKAAGSSPFAPVYLVEDHSQALPIVARTGKTGLFVLHIDGHDDLWPPPSATQIEQARKLLEQKQYVDFEMAGLYFTPREKRLYSINNFLVIAYRLGMISEVYWAFPTLTKIDENVLQSVITSLRDRGPLSNPDDFKLVVDLPYIRGTISGVPVTIGSLHDLPGSKQPVWLDIDLDFFPPLYKTPVNSSYRGILASLAERLQKSPMHVLLTTIAYSHHGGHLDIRERYLGNWLHTILNNPGILASSPPESWLLKEEANYQEYFYQHEEALKLYKKGLKSAPNNADAHFSIASLLARAGENDKAIEHLNKAYALDRQYILGFPSAANIALADKRESESERIILAGLSAKPSEPLLWDYLGNLYFNQGRYEKALKSYQKVIETGGASPLTYSYLGDCHLRLGQKAMAITSHREAIDLFKSDPATLLTASTWISLAKLYAEEHRLEDARQTFQEYLSFFPTAPDSLRQEMNTLLAPVPPGQKEQAGEPGLSIKQ